MTGHIQCFETILFVEDQEKSSRFYTKLLRKTPDLEVPGMTEFRISATCKLGLMPSTGIARILDGKIPHPDGGQGIPRCELYLFVGDVQSEYEHAIHSGATLISPPALRNWGDTVCYLSDPDGHIIAFAGRPENTTTQIS